MRSYRLKLGEHFNEGARQLWLRMESEGWEQADVIRRIRKFTGKQARGLLPRYLFGDQRPGAEWARRIEIATGVPAGLWGEDPKASFVPPAVARAHAALQSADDTGDRPSATGTDGP